MILDLDGSFANDFSASTTKATFPNEMTQALKSLAGSPALKSKITQADVNSPHAIVKRMKDFCIVSL